MRLLLASLFVLTVSASVSAQGFTCTITDYGKSCGPVLKAVATPNGNTYRVALNVTKAQPGSVLLMLIGVGPLDLPLTLVLPKAGLDCRLLTAPVFMQQHRANAAGKYTYARALPSTSSGGGVAQFVELRPNGAAYSTNGIALECK